HRPPAPGTDEEPEVKAVADQMRRVFLDRAGLTEQQMTCLILGGRSYGRCHQDISGGIGDSCWQLHYKFRKS
ncbi:unnamed protein product, partial [Amoebophrya sp. A25]